MQLGTLHQQVSNRIRRGTAMDAVVPDYVQEAGLWLEQNYTFRYMNRFSRDTIDLAAQYPERLEFPNARVKRIDFVRLVSPGSDLTETYRFLQAVTPMEVSSLSQGWIEGYWQDGDTYLWLDAIPTEALVYEIGWQEFTDWPTDLTAEPAILKNYWNVVKCQAMVFAATDMKDPRMVDTYTNQRNEALSTVLRSEEEARQAAEGKPVLRYWRG